eukprot:jgi/Tetstr1/424225/TSEL_000155.t1
MPDGEEPVVEPALESLNADDFTPYLARARNHAEAIDKAFRFRLAFLRRLNDIKRVHATRKRPLLLEWRQQLHVAGVDEDVAVDASVAAKDAFGSHERGQRTLDMLSSSLSAQTLKSYAGRLSQFAEFCHDSENISPLEASTATIVRTAVRNVWMKLGAEEWGNKNSTDQLNEAIEAHAPDYHPLPADTDIKIVCLAGTVPTR